MFGKVKWAFPFPISGALFHDHWMFVIAVLIRPAINAVIQFPKDACRKVIEIRLVNHFRNFGSFGFGWYRMVLDSIKWHLAWDGPF